MKNKETKTNYSGLTFSSLLQVALIVLKLCNVIDWSWWWVLAPIWAGTALGVICGLILFFLGIED